MDENKEYAASFEIKEVVSSTLNEFTEKVEELTKNGEDISNIVAIVVTKKLS